jgi:hypothetical protein
MVTLEVRVTDPWDKRSSYANSTSQEKPREICS